MKKLIMLGFLILLLNGSLFSQKSVSDATINKKEKAPVLNSVEINSINNLIYPIGTRYNFAISESMVLKSYNRYYLDVYGISSYTVNIQIPVKLSNRFSLTPTYGYYTQASPDYNLTYNEFQANSGLYNSGFDLSNFYNNQYSIAISYSHTFPRFNLGLLNLKNIDLSYKQYNSLVGNNAGYVAMGLNFAIDKD